MRSTINGVPSIAFFDRLQQLLVKEMATTVVVKLLGRNIGYNTFQNKIYNLWRSAMPFKLMDVEHGYFLVKFQSNEDFEKGTRELKDVARDQRVLLLGAEGTSTEPLGGRGGRFKVAGNSRVPLVDAMNPMAELISDQIGSSFGTDAANTVGDTQKDLENP
ncbi:hypothetical protein Goklo_026231 [Gossypium klotzschianum]|uniref:DUF4283 domain-containing protein n=1 Tax=Gossypium klotzschianum TaxID=34286 RepID=A0A7J8TU65_9ROSI|nr:hypothetical protein [Gossypium klotzschianum]